MNICILSRVRLVGSGQLLERMIYGRGIVFIM